MEQKFTKIFDPFTNFENEEKRILEILQNRETSIQAVTDNFQAVSQTLEIIFEQVLSANFDTKKFFSSGNKLIVDLPANATNQIIAGAITWVNSILNTIWFGYTLDGPLLQNDIRFQMFVNNFLKLKKIEETNGTFSTSFKTRSVYLPTKKQLLDAPYTVHTHFDLPNFLRSFSMNPLDLLTLILAAAHDSFEEGSIILLAADGGKTHSMVSPDHFFTHLENKSLGLQLQVGIQALTEPTMEELEQNMNRAAFNQVISSEGNRLLRNAKKTFSLDVPRKGGHQVDEDFAYDFLQYGCLGMQYELIVKVLNKYASLPEGSYKLTPIELRSLASSIIRVEIADRMSEMADLYYLFERRKDIFTPEYLKMEYLLTGGRMVNAYYHLIKARDTLLPDAPDYENIQSMLKHYLPFLTHQVNAINTVMQKSGRGVSLNYDEVMHYAKHDYHNQQEWVNSLTTPFMQERVKNILSCLS